MESAYTKLKYRKNSRKIIVFFGDPLGWVDSVEYANAERGFVDIYFT